MDGIIPLTLQVFLKDIYQGWFIIYDKYFAHKKIHKVKRRERIVLCVKVITIIAGVVPLRTDFATEK